MNSFEKIIGYDSIKTELMQICDMIKNPDIYSALGAKLPRGVLLYGPPGLGKTMMAKCFIEESGLPSFTVRKVKSEDFVEYITEIFSKAGESGPSIVFLDDMDKFANEDDEHVDAEEYVAIQAAIDGVRDKAVFVIATANELWKLPKSLLRSGRFDRDIEFFSPNETDCKKIIEHYLADKSVSDKLNIDDISKMITYSSCADLEVIINEAAIEAGFKRKAKIDMDDVVKAVLKKEYNAPDELTKVSEAELKKVAFHEAGHVVMSDILCPGSVGLASLRVSGNESVGGFVRRCKKLKNAEEHALVSLAGKVAVELYYGECADGCSSDVSRATDQIRREMAANGLMGFGMLDVSCRYEGERSPGYLERSEAVVQSELHRIMYKAKSLLLKNKNYLEAVVNALLEKETLVASDVLKIKEKLQTE